MGQKRTWSFHHVPFSMLWEHMPLDYKNNWNSIMFSSILNIYSSAIFDKENSSSKFVFTWKNKFMPVSLKNVFRKNKKSVFVKGVLDRWVVKPTFHWINNANKGTNETTCTRSHLVNIGNHRTIINFFFRENFNLDKLQKGRAVKSKKKIKCYNVSINTLAVQKTRKRFCWTARKWFRKALVSGRRKARRNLKKVFSMLGYRLRRSLMEFHRGGKVSRRFKVRIRLHNRVRRSRVKLVKRSKIRLEALPSQPWQSLNKRNLIYNQL